MLDQSLAEAMQRVLAKDEERFPLTKTLLRLVDSGIGTKRGRSVYFSAHDRGEMREWLLAKGFSLEPANYSGLARSERLKISPNEKAGGEAIKLNRVSIKALVNQPLRVGGANLFLPSESHLDIDWTTISGQVGHPSVVVVENYENFNRIHETGFSLPPWIGSPLVVYRGDPNESRLDNVLKFLERLARPTLAFVDADPAGLAAACALSNLAGIVLPPREILEGQLKSTATARKDLFLEQYPVYGAKLDALGVRHPCTEVWKLISSYRAGIVQERWLSGEVELWSPEL